MAKFASVNVNIDDSRLQAIIDEAINDDATMMEIHTLFAKLIDPWVPMLEGPLHQSVFAQIYPEYVRYGGADVGVPYANYQYNGVDFKHTTTYHPLASAEWDKVAMQSQLSAFEQGVKDILIRRFLELNG